MKPYGVKKQEGKPHGDPIGEYISNSIMLTATHERKIFTSPPAPMAMISLGRVGADSSWRTGTI